MLVGSEDWRATMGLSITEKKVSDLYFLLEGKQLNIEYLGFYGLCLDYTAT